MHRLYCFLHLAPVHDQPLGGHDVELQAGDRLDELGLIQLRAGEALIDLVPVERRYGAEGIGPSIYIKDPDGNNVELKGPPEPGQTGN